MLLATPTNAKPIITNDNFWFMILGEDMKRKEENDYTKAYDWFPFRNYVLKYIMKFNCLHTYSNDKQISA